MAERLEVVQLFLTPHVCLYKLLKYAGVNRASWYYFKRVKNKDKRSDNKGRKPPGNTINRDGRLIEDAEIMKLSKIDFDITCI